MAIYDYKVKAQDGTEVSLEAYRGKVLLIVNTATGCGFTPQYSELQEIYEEFHDKGLEILDFPQFAKVEVNGENAIPLYRWLQDNSQFNGFGKGAMSLVLRPVAKRMDADYKNNSKIKWNFTKFLIDREGNVKERFEPTADMAFVEDRIKELL